ncbi:hypothetical protein [Rhizobium sp. L43]|uniref:hypothetical protein n=1 Tax=Rhizobium sp. L43 TaxID=2035452 RepID=UPI00117B0EC0|nr:hypothetical protein [Rhizobium sp. L43]
MTNYLEFNAERQFLRGCLDHHAARNDAGVTTRGDWARHIAVQHKWNALLPRKRFWHDLKLRTVTPWTERKAEADFSSQKTSRNPKWSDQPEHIKDVFRLRHCWFFELPEIKLRQVINRRVDRLAQAAHRARYGGGAA